jgi:hypothetical protein
MEMSMYVIYDHPKDFPAHFVVRQWKVVGPDEVSKEPQVMVARDPHALTDTLEEARSALPEGLYRIPRYQGDDPVITEVWL